MGGASCKVAKSQWERLLREALLHWRSKLQSGRVLVGRGSCAKRCSMGRASCKVAESRWERLLREVLLHRRSKLQDGRVPVGEALTLSIDPLEEQAAKWQSPSGRGCCAKRCSMGGASCKVAES
ncbi:hypothetical protein Adt_13590 [Abeliophyllum distichum]|uniref:Uncharacterized protein n=1 Tax=Abeliophyllum distichum TaxID=126358 RepID=A0ABD1TXP7_9LAMI